MFENSGGVIFLHNTGPLSYNPMMMNWWWPQQNVTEGICVKYEGAVEVGEEEGQRLTSFVVNIPSAPFKFEQAHNFIHLIQNLRNWKHIYS